MDSIARSVSQSLRCTTIYVDSYNDKIPAGRLRCGDAGQEKPFSGLMQLLLLTESSMRDNDFPAGYMQPRRFCAAAGTLARDMGDAVQEKSPPGTLATFRLKIIFRQNAGWQGTLAWVDGGQEQSFRSVLEMAMLLDSALDSGTKPLEITA